MTVSRALLAAVAAALVATAASAAGRDPRQLHCTLSLEGPPHAGGPVRVRMTLRNAGERPLWVLRWGTPLEEGWLGTPFALRDASGNEVPFRGAQLKRGDPRDADYVEIAAHGELSATADLAAAYDLTRPGTYELRVDRELYDLTSKSVPRLRDRFTPAPLDCMPLRIIVAPLPR